MRNSFILFFLVFFLNLISAQKGFEFIENQGQWADPFITKLNIPGGALFLEEKGLTYHFIDLSELHAYHGKNAPENYDPVISGHVVKVDFIGAQNNITTSYSNYQKHYYNYYIGNDSRRWKGKIHPSERVTRKDVWKNTDIVYYSSEKGLKYDIVVNPGGNPANIKMKFTGATKLSIENGKFEVLTTAGKIVEQEPYAFQIIDGKERQIPMSFELNGDVLSFLVNKNYNPELPLIIDPLLVFASYTGSTSDNFGMTATYDYDGHLFTGGTVYGPGYPTTPGAYKTTTNLTGVSMITDVVITKFSPDGSTLVYSTYLGGGTATTGTETVNSLIVNKQNELYAYGVTSSSDFPTTADAYNRNFKGGTPLQFMQNGTNFAAGTDIYVTKFNANGTALIGSTLIGGSRNDGVNANPNPAVYSDLMYNYGDQYRGEIMVDDAGFCYVATVTQSSDFPTKNAFQNALGGTQDGVVFKLTPTLDSLIWSTYLGGSNRDAAYSLKLDDSLNVFVSGGTMSNDFPTTAGALNPSLQGGVDGFVVKLANDGSSILRGTYLGTNAYDQAYFVYLDGYRDVYLYGQTANPSAYPVMNVTYSNPNSGQFVTKLDSSLSTIIYSSIFGNGSGMPNISPSAFLVDICGNVYISGWGGNILTGIPVTGMPTSPDAQQSSSTDGFNFYIAVFTSDFTSLKYGTYFGGPLSQEHVDGGTSRFDDKGVIYQSVCAGCSRNNDFPTTPGAWSNINRSNNCNNGVFKLDIQLPFTIAKFEIPDTVCSTYNYQMENLSTGATTYFWDFGDGDTSTLFEPSHTYNSPGTYTIMLAVLDSSFITCISRDTIYKTITIIPNSPNLTLPTVDICAGASVQIGTNPISGSNYTWAPATYLNNSTISNPIAKADSSIAYVILKDNGVCVDTLFQSINVTLAYPIPGFDITANASCDGVTLTFNNLSQNTDSVQYYANGKKINNPFNINFGDSIFIDQIAYSKGCTDTLSKGIKAGSFEDYFNQIIMPNVFTPYETPGENDYFCPIGLNGQNCYKMIIYNRWGRSVFESSDEKPCWDGRINKTTNMATDGVYYYVIEFDGKQESKAGFLHLFMHGLKN